MEAVATTTCKKKCASCDTYHDGDFSCCHVHDGAIHQNTEQTLVGKTNCGCAYGDCGCVMVDLEPFRVFEDWDVFCIEDPVLCTEPPVLPVLPDLPALVWPGFECLASPSAPCFDPPPRTPVPAFCPDVAAPTCAPAIPEEPAQVPVPPIEPANISVPTPPCPGDGEIRCSETDIDYS